MIWNKKKEALGVSWESPGKLFPQDSFHYAQLPNAVRGWYSHGPSEHSHCSNWQQIHMVLGIISTRK
jgi:hypothetical protein